MNHVIHIPKAGMMLITDMVFFSRELDGIGSLTWGTVGSVMRYPFHGNGANANYRFQEHVSGSPFSIISLSGLVPSNGVGGFIDMLERRATWGLWAEKL